MSQAPAKPDKPKHLDGLSPPQTPCALPVLQLDQRTYDRALSCVHCGLCLPACPTYTETGLESDSPRGRIALIKGMADGRVEPTDNVLGHLELCLDCRACETACPSGVVYHELIEETRARLQPDPSQKTLADRLLDALFYFVFPYPGRLKAALLPARLLQRAGLWSLLTHPRLSGLLPEKLAKMQQMLPRKGPLWERGLARRYGRAPIDGKARARVGMFAGCVGSVLFQDVNRQTIAVLQAAGCEVVVPNSQGCCGAIHHHGGRLDEAQLLARANIDAFWPHGEAAPVVDYVVNNVAGCGAMLKEYDHLLRDDPKYAKKAGVFTERVRDITELLVEIEAPRPPHAVYRNVTYHDPCHLAHAQQCADPPREVLDWIEGLQVTPLGESQMCCGAAGTYNLSQPTMARQLAERKVEHIRQTNVGTCVTGNAGCAMQIQSEADRLRAGVAVVHPVTLLHEAYYGQGPQRR